MHRSIDRRGGCAWLGVCALSWMLVGCDERPGPAVELRSGEVVVVGWTESDGDAGTGAQPTCPGAPWDMGGGCSTTTGGGEDTLPASTTGGAITSPGSGTSGGWLTSTGGGTSGSETGTSTGGAPVLTGGVPDPGGGTTGTGSTSGGSSTSTSGPPGLTGGTTASTTYDATGGAEDSGTDSGETDAPPNPCSDRCPFDKGGGLAANQGGGSPLAYVEGCARNRPPAPGPLKVPVGTDDIVACLTNLACHLGRDPTKIEALQALGVATSASMLGTTAIASPSSDSGQPIPNATVPGPKGMRALRIVSAPFFEGEPWCSFTTLADDNTLECMNLGFVKPKGALETCGTEPVGIALDELCSQIDGSEDDPASAAVFDELAATAVDGGQTSCDVCHGKMEGVTAANKKPCYFFPIGAPSLLCPLETLTAICPMQDAPTCADKSKPRCPSQSTQVGAAAMCLDGKAAVCQGGANATCTTKDGAFSKDQIGPNDFDKTGSVCFTLPKIVSNAKAAAMQLPAPKWTDISFITAYIDAFCG